MKAFVRDGHVRQITMDDLKPGVVLREVSKEPGFEDGAISPPFADATVIQVKWRQNEFGDNLNEATVVIARPYLYATGVDTACPNVLMGFEKLEVDSSRLVREDSIYMLVVGSRGQSFKFVT